MSPDTVSPEPEEAGERPRAERPISALIADLANQMRALVRLEIALLKAELASKLHRLGLGLIALAIGAFLLFSGWIALLATATLSLATVVRPWLAALIVGLAALLTGALLLYLGKRWLDPEALVPRRSLSSLRQDETWIRGRR